MKIAIMMRAMDKDAGFRAFAHAMTDRMLRHDPSASYVLIYKTRKWLGEFSSHLNTKEVLVEMSSNVLWDQLAVPYVAWRERADVIFNVKFFAPLVSHCPVTMGLQEPSWFTRGEEYAKWDRRYQKLMIPISIRKCAHVFPNSTFILEENRRVLGMPIEHATVTYSAADPRFRPETDREELERFRRKYALPERFILVVSRVLHIGVKNSGFFPGKSPEVAYRAFMRVRERIPHELVFAGDRIRDYLNHKEGAGADFNRVRFLDFVPFEEINLLYNLAEIFVNPCGYEGCPNTVLQAMACGCPMIVATQGGSADVAAGAALMARPMDVEDFAEKMLAAATSAALRRELRAKGLERSKRFTWEKSAADTIDALRHVVERCTDVSAVSQPSKSRE
jgi:glycosyltransferase involved in cell wall biosynthesis